MRFLPGAAEICPVQARCGPPRSCQHRIRITVEGLGNGRRIAAREFQTDRADGQTVTANKSGREALHGKNGRRPIAEILAAAGVKRIYGIVGDSLNGLTDAIRRQGKIEWVHVRHEEVAAFAAGAEAHLTGELAVCAGSCGPGNLHLINGLFDCHRSRVPVLAIAAQIPSAEIGAGYFQETHPETLFRECSHYCELDLRRQPDAACARDRDPRGGRQARRVGRGDSRRRGAAARVRRAARQRSRACCRPRRSSSPRATDLDRLAALLNGDGRVTILCGSGCQGAHDELLALGERLKAPMVHALRGKEHVEWDNPYDVGMTGLIGFSSGYYAMLDCDVLLMLGTDFPYRQFYPQGAACASRRSISGRSRSAAARRSISASSATSARRSTRCCRCSRRSATPRISTQATAALSQGAQGPRRTGRRHAGQAADPPAAGRQGDQRSGRRRCRLHLRCRPADGVGGALSGDERQAAADRLVLARLDGQCDGAGDRRAGGISRTGR